MRRSKELKRPEPDGFLLYVDQAEELYIRAEEEQRRRFSEFLAQACPIPLAHDDEYARRFLGALQADKPLFNGAPSKSTCRRFGEAELREVISRPAQLLSAPASRPTALIEVIAQRTAEDSVKDVGALPLLSYTLDDMWTQMQCSAARRRHSAAAGAPLWSLAACWSIAPMVFSLAPR